MDLDELMDSLAVSVSNAATYAAQLDDEEWMGLMDDIRGRFSALDNYTKGIVFIELGEETEH